MKIFFCVLVLVLSNVTIAMNSPESFARQKKSIKEKVWQKDSLDECNTVCCDSIDGSCCPTVASGATTVVGIYTCCIGTIAKDFMCQNHAFSKGNQNNMCLNFDDTSYLKYRHSCQFSNPELLLAATALSTLATISSIATVNCYVKLRRRYREKQLKKN